MLADLEELTAISERLDDFTIRLRRTHTVFANVQAEAEATIQNLTVDPSAAGHAYKLLGAERHRADALAWAASRKKQLEPAFSVHLFEVERLHMQGSDSLRRFIAETRKAPDVEEAFRRSTNSLGVTAEQMLLLALVEQSTIANVRSELATASPTRRVEMYKAASITPFEPVSATIIKMLESAPPYPPNVADSDDERRAAAELGRLIKEAQHERIPAEVVEVQAVLDNARRQISASKTIGATPINPEHRPDVAALAEVVSVELAEMAELAQAAGQ